MASNLGFGSPSIGGGTVDRRAWSDPNGYMQDVSVYNPLTGQNETKSMSMNSINGMKGVAPGGGQSLGFRSINNADGTLSSYGPNGIQPYDPNSNYGGGGQSTPYGKSNGGQPYAGGTAGGNMPNPGGGVGMSGNWNQNQTTNLGFGGGLAGSNPYLDNMAGSITNRMNDNWTRNLAPSVRSGAMAAGGYGGSRQGVIEANGLKDLNQGLGDSLANLYGNDFSQQRQYDLGLRTNDLGFAGLDANINQNNFNNNLAGANFGLNAWQAQQNQNQNGITNGNNIQNTPYNNWNNFNTGANNVGQGLSSNTSSQTGSGNPWLGGLAGWDLGSKWLKSA